MRVSFTKMHGLGNDFAVFDCIRRRVDLTREQIRRIAQRRYGVGCDQVLLLERADTPDVDFKFRIFNADGGEVEHCGNGARCLARFVRDCGLTNKSEMAIQTLGGVVHLRVETDGQVTVDMGVPEFDPVKIPFAANTPEVVYDLDIGGKHVAVSVLSLGNPHAVQIVEDVDDGIVATLGPLVENHPRFPNRVNAGFMQVLDPRHIRLRVHERGVGETLACGTGATAAVIAGCRRGLLGQAVEVTLPGGTLHVSWPGDGEPAFLRGPAVTTYEGSLDVERL